jgi:hypothetical protein
MLVLSSIACASTVETGTPASTGPTGSGAGGGVAGAGGTATTTTTSTGGTGPEPNPLCAPACTAVAACGALFYDCTTRCNSVPIACRAAHSAYLQCILDVGINCGDLAATAASCAGPLTAFDACRQAPFGCQQTDDESTCECSMGVAFDINCREGIGCTCWNCEADPSECEGGHSVQCAGSANCSHIDGCCSAYHGIAGW